MARRRSAGRVTADSYAADSYTGSDLQNGEHYVSPVQQIKNAEQKAGITNTGSINGIDTEQAESAAQPTEKDAALLKLIEAIEGVIKPGQKPAATV
ncbi:MULTISPECIES: hypothetical protein [Paraburkholderia]|uniref:hypothetical protein n=1 Tax=Paraburkholderia TaxID=1822464 RepID=UPI00224F0021|nr:MULTISPECIES: hypothetical protein [Paraburkholderia]MCX4170696.1 hypothetical protein [Paraburkholderia madseniana]MDQ6458708.1 hypothetical protein [Paraburkholderia madseniana]